METSASHVIAYLCITLVTAIFSGVSGGGAGFINTPLLILLGLSPAQAVATGKLTGLAVATGSLGGLRKVEVRSKKELAIIMALALVVGLGAPFVIVSLESDVYRRLLGVLLLIMAPLLIVKKMGRAKASPSPKLRVLGYAFLVGALCLQAIFSAGMGTLVNVVLIALLGMSALEANLTKRYSQVILNTVIVLGVLATGLIVWPLALAGAAGSLVGSYIGGKLAVKKGERFVMAVFVTLMAASGLALVFGL
ncbi:MAG: sulfite exporter TauE/SafE family protein [Candidatus Saccharimonadales bacterium]